MVSHFRLRLYLLAILVMVGFGVLVSRLYQIQVNESKYYTERLPGRKLESIRIPGIRGEIKDRNGLTLVDSTPNYELHFDLREIVSAYKKDFLEAGDSLPEVEWERFDRYSQREKRTETDIIKIVEKTVFPGLGDLGLLADYSASSMKVHYRATRGYVPFTYRRDLSFQEFARFAENNLGIPGVTVTRTGRRRYIYDSLGCHFLGYMNLADNDQVPEDKKRQFNYYVGDDYGVQGVEATMDSYLQGKPGKLVIEKDEKGKFVGEQSRTDPQPGSDVYLTIDARLQYVTEKALRKIGRGAAVAINPQNGDILSMASVPSFNPNVFIPNVSSADWKRYTGDQTSPMFNRAVNPYSPGSTCKIPIALAGCLSNTWKYRFSCGGGARYGRKFMKCWHPNHGSIDLSNAIKRSCNGYFYRYANHTGIRNIQQMTGLLGLGRKTGIRITGENPGNIPNPEWLRQQGALWSDAFTALVAIGQGATECSPLQMAWCTASIVNGGKVYQPRIIKKVMEKDGEVVMEEPPEIRHDLTKEGVTASQLELIKKGMRRVVNESGGTAGRASSSMTTISGKTGTAQTSVKNVSNAWFIAFAPYENPEIAVCVFVENGYSGGGAASPIAKNIIENYVAIEDGMRYEVVSLPEAVGHRNMIRQTSFSESEALLAVAGAPTLVAENLANSPALRAESEEESAVDVQEFVPPSLKKREVTPIQNLNQPTIRQEADSRGRVGDGNTQQPSRFQPFQNVIDRLRQNQGR